MINIGVFLIFPCQNSNAESVLIHHRDIALLRKVRGTTNKVDVGRSVFPFAHSQGAVQTYPSNCQRSIHQSKWTQAKVRCYSRRVLEELTLWLVGTIGRRRDTSVELSPRVIANGVTEEYTFPPSGMGITTLPYSVGGPNCRVQLNNYLQVRGYRNRLEWGPPVSEGPHYDPIWTATAYCQSSNRLVYFCLNSTCSRRY